MIAGHLVWWPKGIEFFDGARNYVFALRPDENNPKYWVRVPYMGKPTSQIKCKVKGFGR